MHLTAVELRQRLQGGTAFFVLEAKHGEGDQHLVGMQPGVVAVQQLCLGTLYGFDILLWYQFHTVVYSCQMLGGIEQQGSTRA